jgi:hypothetical protein
MVLFSKTIYICVQFYIDVVHHLNYPYMGNMQDFILEINKQKTITTI